MANRSVTLMLRGTLFFFLISLVDSQISELKALKSSKERHKNGLAGRKKGNSGPNTAEGRTYKRETGILLKKNFMREWYH